MSPGFLDCCQRTCAVCAMAGITATPTITSIEVVGEAADGAAAVDLARSLQADVVLMDIRMPGTDGLEATRQIAADPELSGVRVIILTTFATDEYVFEAIRAGASGERHPAR